MTSLTAGETVREGRFFAPIGDAIVATYIVASDCTGTFTAPGETSPALSFVIVGNGKEILAIQTVPGTVVSATGIKQ